MPGKLYIVKQGDWLGKIARDYRISDWKRIWDHEKNKDLKEERENPNVLYPGDKLWIPEPDTKVLPTEGKKPGTKIIVVRKPGKERLRVKFLDQSGRPKANAPCQISFGGKTRIKSTDKNGIVEDEIPPEATQCTIIMDDPTENSGGLMSGGSPLIWTVKLGHLDPVTKASGQQARLANLGYYRGPLDKTDKRELLSATEEFQCDYGLPVHGRCDAKTQAKLKEVHGS